MREHAVRRQHSLRLRRHPDLRGSGLRFLIPASAFSTGGRDVQTQPGGPDDDTNACWQTGVALRDCPSAWHNGRRCALPDQTYADRRGRRWIKRPDIFGYVLIARSERHVRQGAVCTQIAHGFQFVRQGKYPSSGIFSYENGLVAKGGIEPPTHGF